MVSFWLGKVTRKGAQTIDGRKLIFLTAQAKEVGLLLAAAEGQVASPEGRKDRFFSWVGLGPTMNGRQKVEDGLGSLKQVSLQPFIGSVPD